MSNKLIDMSRFLWPEFYTDCRLFCFRMLFSYYGFYPSEEDIIGLGEGLNLQLQNVSNLSTKIYCPLGRTLNFEVDYSVKIHLPIVVNVFAENAIEDVVLPIIKKIDAGFPVVVNVDRYYLDYLSVERAHVGFHAVLVVGYNTQSRTLLIIDSLVESELIEVPYEMLYQAVTSECIISTNKMWYHVGAHSTEMTNIVTIRDRLSSVRNTAEKILFQQIEPMKEFVSSIKAGMLYCGVNGETTTDTRVKKYIDLQTSIFLTTFEEQDRAHSFYRKIYISYLAQNISYLSQDYSSAILACGNQLIESIRLVNESRSKDVLAIVDAISSYVQCEQSFFGLVLHAICYPKHDVTV